MPTCLANRYKYLQAYDDFFSLLVTITIKRANA